MYISVAFNLFRNIKIYDFRGFMQLVEGYLKRGNLRFQDHSDTGYAVKEILAIHPGAKVLVSSGYSNDPIMANYKDYGFFGAIEKQVFQGKTENRDVENFGLAGSER